MNKFVFFSSLLCFLLSCSNSKDQIPDYSNKNLKTPELFAPGIISTEENNEFDLCFTPDGKTVYFTRRFPGTKQKIYKTDFKDGTWTQPEIASFSTDRDETPFITPDGNTMYFGSQREIPGKPNKGNFDMNVWMMTKSGNAWSDPSPLPEPINYVQEEGENWPSSNNNFLFTPDGKTHYFSTMFRGSKAMDVYKSDLIDGNFSPPERLEGFFENDTLWKYSPSISPDGKYMVFNSYLAPGGLGGEDLYISKKTSSGWSKAANMGPMVNSVGEEGSGRFSPDGKYFFFTHADNLGNYEYGTWSIYFVETEFLDIESMFK